MTEVPLLLGTIICLGAFFLIDNNIPVQALHKEEQLLEDYDDLADFANAVRNGDTVRNGDKDLEEIQIRSMESAGIYNDADDNMKDCIEPATEVGHSLSKREVIHCVYDANYFQNKYSSISTNSTVRANTTFATSTAVPDTDNDTAINTTSTSDTSTSDTSASDTSTSDTSTSDTSASDTSASDTSASDTSASDTSASDTSASDTSTSDTSTSDTSTSDDTSSGISTNDTQATSTNDTQATSTNETASSNNEENQVDTSNSNNNGNLEDYDSLSDLVNDIKNGVVDTDEISLNNFQNSEAYQGADEQTQDCIDLAGKIGGNLIDYEIVR
ncbi:MAG TPA: hypothetical protein VL854_05225, partial [Nitrososphaeraceae archaeon]|nr:hypothetical protein [Nitrososphaeraceae archaeon]